MPESLVNPSDKAGLPPGAIVHVGEVPQHETRIKVVDIGTGNVAENQLNSLHELAQYKDTDSITWVIVEGLRGANLVAELEPVFGIHPLVIEDILNTHQRAKFEEHEHYVFIVMKGLLSDKRQFHVRTEQVSLLLLDKFVFTFKERQDDLLQPILQRIKAGKGRFHSLGPDYLVYTVLDIIIDNLFLLVDTLDEQTNALEDKLLTSKTTQKTLRAIQGLKRELIHVRRNITPMREVLAGMMRSESTLISDKTGIYLRDALDHTIRIVESIESYRDILSSLLEIYVSTISNKMNEIMKVLTVFASIFIPLTFLTGIYGMNFQHMPELSWNWAYPALWVLFITIPVVLMIYFKKKRWL
jgi:magnesium transporter